MIDLTPQQVKLVSFREKLQMPGNQEYPAQRLSGHPLLPDTYYNYNVSSAVLHSNDAVVSTDAGALTKVKEIDCGDGVPTATLRIYFEMAHESAGNYTTQARIYKNGSAVGTLRQIAGVDTAWTAYTEDLSFIGGDLIQIYANTNSGGGADSCHIRYFRILGALVIPRFEWANTLS